MDLSPLLKDLMILSITSMDDRSNTFLSSKLGLARLQREVREQLPQSFQPAGCKVGEPRGERVGRRVQPDWGGGAAKEVLILEGG